MAKTIKGKIILYFKKKLLRKKAVIIHNNTVFSSVDFLGTAVIEPYCRLNGDPKIIIGDNFYCNAFCHFLGEITIGENVMIGPKTVIWGRDHGMELNGIPMKKQGHIKKPIIINDDVWIGAGVTILKGVTVGSGAVIGAGSIVTKDVLSNAIVVGNPAKFVKYRNEP